MLPENRPIRIQRKRSKGWKAPGNTISVTRPSKWGNPYLITEDRDARDVCIAYETSLICKLAKDTNGTPLIDQISELRGKNIMCWCKVGDPCHGDVLLRLANSAIASVGGVG